MLSQQLACLLTFFCVSRVMAGSSRKDFEGITFGYPIRVFHPCNKSTEFCNTSGQILHARSYVRMECSFLTSHLYHKKNCRQHILLMQGFERADHFLFICQRYTSAGHTYLQRNLVITLSNLFLWTFVGERIVISKPYAFQTFTWAFIYRIFWIAASTLFL